MRFGAGERSAFCMCGTHEFRRGRGAGGADLVALEDAHESQCEYFEVEPEGAVLDVPEVEFEFLVPGNRVAAVDLGPAGHAGFYFVPAGLPRGVAGIVLHEQWTRADEAHFAAENIEHFGKFIQ